MCLDRIPRLYHFCDASNIESIRQHGGIYSAVECERRGIVIPVPGGDAESQKSDRANGTDRDVHLSFTTGHPMAYRAAERGQIQRVVWVHIKPQVLEIPGVRFTAGLANTRGIPFYTIQEACDGNLIDFQALYGGLDWRTSDGQGRRQAVEKYEILVPTVVPIDSIFYLPNG